MGTGSQSLWQPVVKFALPERERRTHQKNPESFCNHEWVLLVSHAIKTYGGPCLIESSELPDTAVKAMGWSLNLSRMVSSVGYNVGPTARV